MKDAPIKVGLAGNPNSGKTTIFNNLTGGHQHIGNWPGVTVEKKAGAVRRKGRQIEAVDLPGTYSLSAYTIEETIARDYIITERPDVVINVIDASNIERNLYLTAQLIELGAPLVIALNMVDVAEKRRIKIDCERLSVLLGAPVVRTVGRTGKGTEELIDAVIAVAEGGCEAVRHIHVPYGGDVEEQVNALQGALAADSGLAPKLYDCPIETGCDRGDDGVYSSRWLAVRLIEADEGARKIVADRGANPEGLLGIAHDSAAHIRRIYDDDPEAVITDRLYGFVKGLSREAVDLSRAETRTLSDSVDAVLTHKIVGIPIFLFLMWLMFQATFTVGAYPAEWIGLFFDLLKTGAGHVLDADSLLGGLVINGIIDGVGGVLVFLPNIVILFLFIAFLEDTGYMARAAFLMDRVMHMIGLHGKSFISLVSGFGCNAPAIMTTRTLEARSDRLITILINPLMSCSARLPVYVLFAGAFFPDNPGAVIFVVYAVGIALAIGMGKLFRKTLFKGEAAPFVMELPPYRLPTGRSLFIHMWEKSSVFLRKAGTVILAGVVIVWALNTFPRNVALEQDYAGLREISKAELELELEHIKDERRRALEDLRKTYDNPAVPLESSAVYIDTAAHFAALADSARADTTDALKGLAAAERAEIASKKYAGRMGRALEPVLKPLGFNWRAGVALVPGFIAKEIVVGSLAVLYRADEDAAEGESLQKSLAASGDFTPLSAFAFMVFTLIYVPCLATVAVIKKETGSWRWALFSIAYSMALAWIVAFVIFRGGLLLGFG